MQQIFEQYGWHGHPCGSCGGRKWKYFKDDKPDYMIEAWMGRKTFRVHKDSATVTPSGKQTTRKMQVYAGRENDLEKYLQTI